MFTSAAAWLGVAALVAGAFCLVVVVIILRRPLSDAGRSRPAAAPPGPHLTSAAPDAPVPARGLARPQIEKRLAA
jgi:hypothetical protein